MNLKSPRPRLLFFGTPDLARTILAALVAQPRWEIALVVTQPDRPVGRGLEVQPTPVKLEALQHGIPVLQPDRCRDPAFLQTLRDLQPDSIVVAAYGQILPHDLLQIPRRPAVNLHTSLLPRWRGAAPIQWAILDGDSISGVSLMQIEPQLDAGPVIASLSTPITDDDTAQSLHDRLARLGADLVVRELPRWLEGQQPPTPQPAEGITYARRLSREDGRIDWSQPALRIWRQIRAFNPWPGAFTPLPAPPPDPSSPPQPSPASPTASSPSTPTPAPILKVWSAQPIEAHGPPGRILEAAQDRLIVATGEGALAIHSLQREGRRRLSTRDFLASGTLRAGDQFPSGPAADACPN